MRVPGCVAFVLWNAEADVNCFLNNINLYLVRFLLVKFGCRSHSEWLVEMLERRHQMTQNMNMPCLGLVKKGCLE